MRRPWTALAAVSLLACGAAADSPFAGTWKVLIPLPPPQAGHEANLWIVRIDKAGKKVEIVAGVNKRHQEAAIGGVRIDPKGLRFTVAPATGPAYQFVLLPPAKDDAGMARGSAAAGPLIAPAWLERTEQAEIDGREAVQKLGGMSDLEAALRKTTPAERRKELAEVGRNHPGRAVGLLAHQQLLGELVRLGGPPGPLEAAARAYAAAADPFGQRLAFSTRLQIANILRGRKDTAGLAVEYARSAVERLSDDLQKPFHLNAHLTLLSALAAAGRKPDLEAQGAKVREVAEALAKASAADEQRAAGWWALAAPLLAAPEASVADLGLRLARDAHALLPKDATAEKKLRNDRLLRDALAARGRADEARELSAAIDRAEAGLDAAFEKANVPFEVKPFAGRKGSGGRAVLVELFTGVQSAPCAAADVAFDAGLRAYPARDVVFLRYHQHDPGPDPLTSPDGEGRWRFYASGDAAGTPTVLIDGRPGPALGGGARAHAEDRFGLLRRALAEAVEVDAEATLRLIAKRDGGRVLLRADYGGLKTPGDKLRLRFVLVEEVVRFPGSSGQRLHRNVARSFPGGVAGVALGKKEGSLSVTADVGGVRRSLEEYLSGHALRNGFTWADRPLELKRLKGIAFVQDDETRRVLQAAQVEVE